MAQRRTVRIAEEPDDGNRLGTKGARDAILIMLVLLGAIFLGLPIVFPRLLEDLDSVVLLIAGFVTLTLVLYFGTVVMTALGMRTPTEALGMPAGSIRALIAMVLILIFAIIGVVVLQEATTSDTYESTGVTQAQIDAIRAAGGVVLEQDIIPAASAAPGASPAEAMYVARIRPSMTREGHDFALQLLTTVSTLVVAVAGFYFGSKNVENAVTAAKEFRAPGRSESQVIPVVPDNSRDEDLGDDEDEDEDEDDGRGGGRGGGGAGAAGSAATVGGAAGLAGDSGGDTGPAPGGDGADGDEIDEPEPVDAAEDDAGPPELEVADTLDGEPPR